MTTTIYPDLLEHVNSVDANQMRYNKIKEMRDNLTKLQVERKSIYKKYGKAASVLQNAAIGMAAVAAVQTTAGIATSFTVVGLPIGIILTGLGAATGLSSAILTPICKYLTKKKTKHARKCGVYNTGIATLDRKFSKALNDNMIGDEEFKQIVDDYNTILAQVLDSNPKNVVDLRAQAKKELQEELQQKVQTIFFKSYDRLLTPSAPPAESPPVYSPPSNGYQTYNVTQNIFLKINCYK